MPQLKQYCSWMFKREDWEVAHLHKLIEKEYENLTIQMPVLYGKILRGSDCIAISFRKICMYSQNILQNITFYGESLVDIICIISNSQNTVHFQL